MYQVKITPEIYEKFQGFNAIVIYAKNVSNQPSSEYSSEKLRQIEAFQAEELSRFSKLSDHSYIAAWRKAYSEFGAKPKKYHCSAEALLKRVLKGDPLPRINYLVDIYNAISVKYVIPIGGEDWDKLRGDLYLKFASGVEDFLTTSGGAIQSDMPPRGEVIYADSAGATCRRWNWRQSHRTALTEETKNAYFVLEILPPADLGILRTAAAELCQEIMTLSPDAKITVKHLSQDVNEEVSLSKHNR